MSRESKLAKNTIILSIGTFLPRIASFITLPILTGYLTQEEYGTYDLITVLASLFLPAVTLQIQSAAFRFLIDARRDEQEKSKIISNIYAFIIPVAFLGLLVLFFLLRNMSFLVKISVCLYFFADTLVSATRQVIRGLSKNLAYSVSSILSTLGKVVFLFIVVLSFKWGLLGSILALFMADMISFLYLLFCTGVYKYFRISQINVSSIKQMLKYSWPLVPNSMSVWVMHLSDRLVVTFFMGVTANAVYSVANKIPSLLSFAQSTFAMAWQENASLSASDEDVGSYYSSMFHLIFKLLAGFMSILIALTPVLFKILIKGDYQESYNHIQILFLGIMFNCMASYLGGIYTAFKKTKNVGLTTVLAACANLIIDLCLITRVGLYAASLSTMISYLLLFAYRMYDVKKFVDITYKYKTIIVSMILLCIECILCSRQNIYLDFINVVFASVFFYLLCRDIMRKVFNRILRKR